ncbi:MAG TPA: hypothetical protein VMZ71_03945, partial [Gemmataceae bacterium]|nr:hypothetical protein [Gemmataceae bacterium]
MIERQRRGGLHLEEPAEPRVRHLDLLFEHVPPRLDRRRHALVPDAQVRFAIPAHLLHARIQRVAEVDVRGAVGGGADLGEGVPLEREAGVGAFVLPEDLEHDLIGMHRDDGIEDAERERVVAEHPTEVRLLRLPHAERR